MTGNNAARLVMSLGLVLGATAWAGWTKKGEATAAFHAKATGGVGINCTTSDVTLSDDGTNLVVSVKLTDLSSGTGFGMRDRHMKEDIEAEKYPNITMTVPLTALQVPADGKSLDAKATGVLGFHGTMNPTAFEYHVACDKGVCTVHGTSSFDLTKFGVKTRTFMGASVKPEVAIETSFVVTK